MLNEPDKISALEDHLGYWLRFVSNHVSHAFSTKIAALDVTVAEWVVMRDLFERVQVTPSEIADRIGMTRGAISKLADRLIAKSLIARTADKADRRYQYLALTRSGRALVPKLAALADQNDAQFFDHLSSPERAAIEDIMKKIVQRQDLQTMPID
jgi:DNA-binding MarR family transcriptional regulator